MNEIKKLSIKLNIISELLDALLNMKRGAAYEYEAIGKEHDQAKDYRTGDLLWEDEEKTIPKYRSIYDWVEKTTLTEEEQAKIDLIDEIGKKIAKL